MKTTFLTTFLLSILSIVAYGQAETIYLKNPSFEGYARPELVPEGWRDCGFAGESAPDTHPSGAFEVVKTAADGETYLGMVVRDNDTYEGVGQKLSAPIIENQCYAFRIDLCQSEHYVSASRRTSNRADYTEPIKLVIWAGNKFCEKIEKLGESPLIAHPDWKTYLFTFKPKNSYTHIKLEAFYKVPILFPYNGNILVDNATAILPIDCDSLATYSKESYNELFEQLPTVHVEIGKDDIDESVNSTFVSSVSVVGSRADVLGLTIYYNSRLTEKEKINALKKLTGFVNEYPFNRVNVFIKESSKEERKLQRKKLFRDLKNLDIAKARVKVILLKK